MATTWGATLRGHRIDLQDWAAALPYPFDPWVERVQSPDRNAFILRTKCFDGLGSAQQVSEMAIPLIERMNGVLDLIGAEQPVAFGGVAQFEPGRPVLFVTLGKIEQTLRKMRHGGTLVVLGADGTPLPSPPPAKSDALRWIEVSVQNERVADLLAHLSRSRDGNWYDLYKAIELISELTGGWHALKRKLQHDQWSKLDRSKQTANFYRHARAPKPRVPTSPSEARRCVIAVSRQILAEVAG